MKKIDWDRGFTGIDGRFRDREKIEKWYLRKVFKHRKRKLFNFKDIIRRRLAKIANSAEYGTQGNLIINDIIVHLKEIIIAPPDKLLTLAIQYNKNLHKLKHELSTTHNHKTVEDFNKAVLNAFNYVDFRTSLLPSLAAKMNIKCCPYCNMHYTLVFPSGVGGESSRMIAKFQFDHFFSKSQYPLLSMSLFNLIPSCSCCNLSKSNSSLPIDFHPYNVDIDNKCRFVISKEVLTLKMMKKSTDSLRVRLVASDPSDRDKVRNYADKLNLERSYSRHRDIVDQISEGIYLESYYNNPSNFSNIEIDPNRIKLQELHKQLMLGGTVRREEIGMYPLSKFRHDIYEFLKKGY